MIDVAPTVSGNNNSRTEMSNARVVTASNRSPGPMPGSRAMLERKLTSAACGTQTPFGLPVDPEV